MSHYKFLLSVLILLSITTLSFATNVTWDRGAGTDSWLDGNNWSTNVVPPNNSTTYAAITMTSGPVITSGQTIAIYRILLNGTGNGTMTVNDGTVNVGNHIYVADVSTAVGTLNMNGGAVNVTGTLYIARDNGSVAYVNLAGGTLTTATLNLASNGGTGTHIDLKGGKLIYTTFGGTASNINTAIANGFIKAYGGLGTVIIDTTTQPGKTILSGMINVKATNPEPTNSTVDLSIIGTTIGWTKGMSAVSHDVYFGTSFADVNSALPFDGDLDYNGIVDYKDLSIVALHWLSDPTGTNPYAGVNTDNIVDGLDYALLSKDWKSPSIFKGNQDANSFNPGTLAFGTTYYWRIDEVNEPNAYKGDIWSFTTHSGKAANVLPINGDLSVMSRAVLSWTAAPGAVSHDVYFGTQNPPPYIGNQASTLYNPGGINNSQTYYWRINEHYSGGQTITGDVWSFKTMDAASEPDIVFVQASDPQMDWNNCNPNGIDNVHWGETIAIVNQLNPDFMLVTGDQINSSGNTTQVAEYQGYKAALSPTIPCYEVPGNHDISEPPDASKYVFWQNYFPNSLDDGINPWYYFTYGDSIFIGLDDIVLRSPFGTKNIDEMNWLTQTLQDANAAGYAHKFVFMHVALFITSATEADNSADNLPLSVRTPLLNLFHQYGVKVVMAGHRHTNNYATDGDLQMYTTTSCTCGLGSPSTPPGIRIYKVYPDRTDMELRDLVTLPVGTTSIEKGPYLIYPGNNTQMTVLWQTYASTSASSIVWGTDTNYSLGYANTVEYGTDHQHKYTITGLTPGTKYYYCVKVCGVSYTGSFTAAPASSATAVKFFMYGDTRTNIGQNNTCASRMTNIYTGDPAYQTICLHAGDWVEGDNEATWTAQWFTGTSTSAALENFMRNVPIAGCAGNHEGGSAPVWHKYWPQPYVANAYYSFDYGPVHIAIIDMYNSYTSGSAQYNWLVNDLSTSTKQWKILVFHEPAWNACSNHGNNTTAQATFQPLAQTYGAQICLAGHNHIYSRCAVPLSGTHIIQHITHGAGGAPFYTLDMGLPYIASAVGSTNVIGKVEINGNTLTHTAYNAATGAVVDTVSIDRPTW